MAENENNNIEDVDFEEVETPKKKGLRSLFKAVNSSLKENLRGRVLSKEAEAQERALENNMIEIVLDIAKSSHLTNEEAQEIIDSERFQSLDSKHQDKLRKSLEKRSHANQAEAKRQEEEGEHLQKEAENIEHRRTIAREARETRNVMIENIDECLQRAEHALINEHYEEAITRAEEAKAQIRYKEKTLSAIKSLLNTGIFKIKRAGEAFSPNKSNMTTRLLPDGIDIILKEREEIANAIIGEARAKLKQETKQKKELLAHPTEVTRELEGGWKPIYQGRLIVSFQKGIRILPVVQRVIRTKPERREFFIVQQQNGEHLFGILDREGEPVITNLMRKGYRIVGNNIFYKTVSREQERGFDLINGRELTS